MTTDTAQSLRQIEEATDLILELVETRSFDEFEYDDTFRFAVEYAVLIIVVHMSEIPATLREQHYRFAWAELSGLARWLPQDRDALSPSAIWTAVTQHVPAVAAATASIRHDTADDVPFD